MAQFVRTSPAPAMGSGYQSFRPHVRSDFEETCAYCLLAEILAGGEENFELDHFRPASKFPALKLNFYNLYYACHPCNHIKNAKWPPPGFVFVDFCTSDFSEHFEEMDDGTWRPLTEIAAYTSDALRLNRKHLKDIRLLIRAIGKSRE